MALHHTPEEKRAAQIEKLTLEIADLDHDQIAQIKATGFWGGTGSYRRGLKKRKLAAILAATETK